MKLILVRHGRTPANVMRALDTAYPGHSLDEVGRSQAQTLPARLRELGVLEQIGGLWVSPIERARQTIAPIEAATGLTATVDSGIREVLAADLEMATDAESMGCYIDTTRAWMAGRLRARIPGSPENGVHTLERFDRVVRDMAAELGDAGTGLLVSHGTILRLWTSLTAAQSAGANPRWIADHPMHNTGITLVEGTPQSGWQLQSWDDGAWSVAPA